jgi:hypothetical protein
VEQKFTAYRMALVARSMRITEALWTWMIAHSDTKHATETAFITQSDLRFGGGADYEIETVSLLQRNEYKT